MAQIQLIVIAPAATQYQYEGTYKVRGGVQACSVKPPRDVQCTENSQQYIVTAHMQGYRPEEIQVQVERSRILVLSGQRRGSLIFKLRYELPGDARPDDAEAVWTSGILTITIPKALLGVTVPIFPKRNNGGVRYNNAVPY